MIGLKAHRWLFCIVAVFAGIYACSLSFNYAEGDAASSIAFHAMGRDPAIQPPFANYQVMADVFLRLVPANEKLLRHVTIGLAALTAPLMVMLMLSFAFRILNITSEALKLTVSWVLLIAVPEFFFLGLVYLPSVWAMCLVLAAHHLLLGGQGRVRFVASLVLFSLGAACRWDILPYGLVIVGYLALALPGDGRSVQARMTRAVLWGALALGGWLVALAAAGCRPHSMVDTMVLARAYYAGRELNVLSIANSLSLVKPVFAVLVVMGWLRLRRERNPLAWVAVLGLLPVLVQLNAGIPKRLLPAVPMAVACFVVGVRWLLVELKAERRAIVVPVLGFAMLLPWVMGFRATMGDTAWGPGFELRAYDRPEKDGTSFDLTIGAGAALPTVEGPRPLWGYGPVLLGGRWRRLVRSVSHEYDMALQQALARHIPILVLQTDGGRITAKLTENGFVTTENYHQKAPEGIFFDRTFTRADGAKVELLRSAKNVDHLLEDKEMLDTLAAAAESREVVVCGYTSTTRMLYKHSPAAMQKLEPVGGECALLDLQRLRHAD